MKVSVHIYFSHLTFSPIVFFFEDVIGEVVEIGQWNLHSKPKKVVFTMKD